MRQAWLLVSRSRTRAALRPACRRPTRSRSCRASQQFQNDTKPRAEDRSGLRRSRQQPRRAALSTHHLAISLGS
ncbi:hypothetical protein ACFPRL_13230 [Pseudoclavibacter helvolus]